MKYASELKKFVTGQYIYAAIRMALAIVVPSLFLAHFGLLKEFFLLPLATSFLGFTDQVGPFIRRRNTILLAIVCFVFVAFVASILKDFTPLIYLEILVFGIFFSMIGVYGQRLSAVGGLTLVVFSIFVDGHLSGDHVLKSVLIFAGGCIWYFIIFLVMAKLRPYRLASQLIGENYLVLADYLKIKAKFYRPESDMNKLYRDLLAVQVNIKNLQEDTREVVFKTRTFVNESTTTSRVLLLMFLNSIDFYEKLMTSDHDYTKLHKQVGNQAVLPAIHKFLNILSEEISHIGIALQSAGKARPLHNLDRELQIVFDEYYELRRKSISAHTLEELMSLRLVLARIYELTEALKTIYKVSSQDTKLAKSLSTGLDYEKFLPKQERLNLKVYLENFSLKSSHFRHAIRLTIAMLLGYAISKLIFLGIGHSYWILITIVAIIRPAYSTTKHRNLLRIYGTMSGALMAYVLLIFTKNSTLLLGILFTSMILCFTFLKRKYSWAVFFMTIYIFIAFNFLRPGSVNAIFKDRILDTLIAGIIVFLVSYFVLPVWERTQNIDLIASATKANLQYFCTVIAKYITEDIETENYKINRKDAIISLANLSDNFQRMLSDPKHQQAKMETVHQFVTTSHLITAYTASLSQYYTAHQKFTEIDFENWNLKISRELERTLSIINHETKCEINSDPIIPENMVDELLLKRKKELQESDFLDRRDATKITYLTQIKNIQDLLELLYDTAREQRKVIQHYYAEHQSTIENT